jgi:hypothetical protein
MGLFSGSSNFNFIGLVFTISRTRPMIILSYNINIFNPNLSLITILQAEFILLEAGFSSNYCTTSLFFLLYLEAL